VVKYQKTYLNNRQVFLLGNEQLLKKKKISIFISRKIPLNIIIPAEEFILSLAELSYVFISGWHSPFERRILKKLIEKDKEIIFYTSKGLKNQQKYNYLEKSFNRGKILMVSSYLQKNKITLYNCIKRNKLISDIANENIFLYIDEDGNLKKLFSKLLSQNKTPLVLSHSANSIFLKKGRPINLNNFKEILL
jgi:predicted Rossmann fold nucleotide-binding protein DprA/Smf involved in DNA uptake